jgi:hypothetical protein
VFAERGQGTLAGLPPKSQLDDPERSAQAPDRAALLQEHMARTPEHCRRAWRVTPHC